MKISTFALNFDSDVEVYNFPNFQISRIQRFKFLWSSTTCRGSKIKTLPFFGNVSYVFSLIPTIKHQVFPLTLFKWFALTM